MSVLHWLKKTISSPSTLIRKEHNVCVYVSVFTKVRKDGPSAHLVILVPMLPSYYFIIYYLKSWSCAQTFPKAEKINNASLALANIFLLVSFLSGSVFQQLYHNVL